MRALPHTTTLVLVLLSIFICLYGLTGLKTNADYRVYFDKNDTLLKTNNEVGNQYSELDSLILILSTEKGTLLASELIDLYSEFEKQLDGIDYVERVTGFFQFLEADVSFDDLNTSESYETPENLLKRLQTNSASKNMITTDGRMGLVNIGIALPHENTAKEVKSFMTAVESVINDNHKLSELSVTVNYSGTLALNEAYIDVVRHDLKRFIPLLFLILSIFLYVFIKNWRISFLLISVSLLSAITAFGVAGWLHWELAAINAFTPIIIMSLNIATSMHIVMNYFRFVADGSSRVDAMTESVRYNFQALTFSKLTTASGFLLLSFSPSPPVQVVGYIVAIGMLVSYILCLTLLRTLLPKLALSQEQAQLVVRKTSLTKFGNLVLKQGNYILVVAIVTIVTSLIALQQLSINDNVYEYFPEDHRFRQGTELIDNHFDGSIRLLYSIDSGEAYGVLEKDYRERLSAFTTWLRAQENVARVDDILSIAVERGVRLDNVRTLLESNTTSMLGLEQQLTEEYRAVKVSIYLKTITASELISFDRTANEWLINNLGLYNYQGGVGPDILFAKLGERNAKSMFFSLTLALVMIAIITGVLLRSLSATFIGLVCNLFPVITVFAVWSLLGGYISLGSAMVMGMIMGIIVDDTLHMLLKFPRASDSSVVNPITSLYERVCPAILITSITLAAGLFVGVFSGFRPIYELSLLSLSIILTAMLADLFFLPALMQVMKFKRV